MEWRTVSRKGLGRLVVRIIYELKDSGVITTKYRYIDRRWFDSNCQDSNVIGCKLSKMNASQTLPPSLSYWEQ